MAKTNHRAAKDFDRSIEVRAVRARHVGRAVEVDATRIQRGDDGERAYQLDDNGTHRVRLYAEVRAMAVAS